MYNIGDKFTIEIEKIIDKDTNGNELDSPLYMMKGFNSLIFDDRGLSILASNDVKSNENEWIKKIGTDILGVVKIIKSEKNGDLDRKCISTTTEILKPYYAQSDKDDIDPNLVFDYMHNQNCKYVFNDEKSAYSGFIDCHNKYDKVCVHFNHNELNDNSSYNTIPICYTIGPVKYTCELIFNFIEYGRYDIYVEPILNENNDIFGIKIVAMRFRLPSFIYSSLMTVVNSVILI